MIDRVARLLARERPVDRNGTCVIFTMARTQMRRRNERSNDINSKSPGKNLARGLGGGAPLGVKKGEGCEKKRGEGEGGGERDGTNRARILDGNPSFQGWKLNFASTGAFNKDK
jgi:hypothetical protein